LFYAVDLAVVSVERRFCRFNQFKQYTTSTRLVVFMPRLQPERDRASAHEQRPTRRGPRLAPARAAQSASRQGRGARGY